MERNSFSKLKHLPTPTPNPSPQGGGELTQVRQSRSSLRFTMSMSVGHGFAGGENGYAVSGGRKRSEGLRGRKARKNAGRGGPAVDAKSASTLSWRFLPLWNCNFGSVPKLDCLTAFRRTDPSVRRADPASREFDDRFTKPAGATSTPSMITVMTETPSGMDRNITGI